MDWPGGTTLLVPVCPPSSWTFNQILSHICEATAAQLLVEHQTSKEGKPLPALDLFILLALGVPVRAW